MKRFKHRNLVLGAVFCVFLHSFALSQTNTDFSHAQEFFQLGNAAMAREHFLIAIAHFSKAINLYPKAPEFFFNRALAYRNARQYDLAIKDFDKVFELSPVLPVSRLSQLHYARGTAYQEKGEYTKSLDDLSRAVALDPTNASFYHNRANTHQFLKQFDLALADSNKALEMMPNPLTFYIRARIFEEIGNLDQAIKDYTSAIDLSPNFHEAFNNRGLSYQKKGDLDAALRDFAKAVSIAPSDGMYYFNRANIHFKENAFRLAVADYTKAIEIYPLWAEAYRRRADSYKNLKNPTLAAIDLRKATEVQKANFSPANKTEFIKP